MADTDSSRKAGTVFRRRRGTPALSPEERASERGRQARRAAPYMTGGPWNWQWRRRHRRGRTMGCLLWLLTLLIVFLVLSVLFGGFQRGTRTGGSGPLPTGPAVTRTAPGAPAVRGSAL
jgi:hypothetical protein